MSTQVPSKKLHDVMMTQKVTSIAKPHPIYLVGHENTLRIGEP